MKKINQIFIIAILSISILGCNNAFAKEEYDSDSKIASSSDRYSKVSSIFNTYDDECVLTVDKFEGRETIWSDIVKEESKKEFRISFSLTAGKAKIVHIDKDDHVTTLLECTAETTTNGFVTKNVTLKKGLKYRCVNSLSYI